MGRHIQTFKLNLTYTVIESHAHGLGALGRMLGHIAGHLFSRQLLVVASLGDVAHIELLAPVGGQGHALVLVEGRAGHGHGLGSLANRCLEELGREPGWRRGNTDQAIAAALDALVQAAAKPPPRTVTYLAHLDPV